MESLTMFDRMLSLPLFQGMSIDELSEVLRHVRLDFVKYHEGDEVVCQGDSCRELVCVINGSLSSAMQGDGYSLHEYDIHGIGMIEPYNMFGLHRRYSRTYFFETEGEVLTLDRDVLLNHILNSRIAKINLLNIVCNQYQKSQRMLIVPEPATVAEKISHFMHSISAVAKGRKQLKMKMVDMAERLQETRLNVSQALNDMQTRGLLTFSRGIIDIYDLADI